MTGLKGVPQSIAQAYKAPPFWPKRMDTPSLLAPSTNMPVT